MLLVGLCVFSELLCRYAIGLGDPPLYQADSAMEYLLQPSKTYSRFHHRLHVNQYSMRSDDFPPQKSSPDELRVLVVGDSIVYGGVLLDQAEISTELLKSALQRQFGRPIIVGAASAKSWGPPNELAYLQRFGTLNADVILLELSSHDYADAPTFVPVVGIAADYPATRPWLAAGDLLMTYVLPRYFHLFETPDGVDRTTSEAAPPEHDIEMCRAAEQEFFRLARAGHAKVALVQHLSLPELNGAYERGYYANQAVAKVEHVPFVDDSADMKSELTAGHSPYFSGDPLHPNRTGQQLLAKAMQRGVILALAER